MKKRLVSIFIFLLIINLFSIQLIISQDVPNTLPEIPVLGKINEDTGLPSSFEKFRSLSENLSDEEKSKQYLYQEWTKLAAKSNMAALFFFTDSFFSFFDPVWEFLFQMKFRWSWEFTFCIVLFICLITIIAVPVREFGDISPLFAILISTVITSLVGKSGVIKSFADLLAVAVKNIWLAIICLIIAVVITLGYTAILQKFGKDLRKKSEEEDLERAKKSIKIHGNLSEEALKKQYGKQ